MTALEFLKSKGLIDPDKTQFVIRFDDGRQIELAQLLDEYSDSKIETVQVKYDGMYRDGGTTIYKDKLGKLFFLDMRISSKTLGCIYDRYPSDEGAEILRNIRLEQIPTNYDFDEK